MNKWVVTFFTALLVLLFSTHTVFCTVSYNVGQLKNCKMLNFDSNSDGAFAYGSNGNTIYSSQLLPSVTNYSLTVDGKLKSLCQNGKYTYALIEKNLNSRLYSVVELNSSNGNYRYLNFENMTSLRTECFAVSNNKVFFLKSDSAYVYVSAFSFDGKKLNNYTFNQNAMSVFTNNNKAYVSLYDGSIYSLSDSSSNYCLTLGKTTSFYNAGAGYLGTDNGSIVSLDGKTNTSVSSKATNSATVSKNSIKYIRGSSIVKLPINDSNTKTFDCKNSIALASFGDKTAVILNNYDCKIITDSEFKDNSVDFINNDDNTNTDYNSKYKITSDNIIFGIQSGTKVTKFKSEFSSNAIVRNDDEVVTTGNVKTGQSVECFGNMYSLSVLGDVTGEGNVKSNDVKLLTSYFVNSKNLSGAYKQSADYNMDSSIDNKDLVLISRKANK